MQEIINRLKVIHKELEEASYFSNEDIQVLKNEGKTIEEIEGDIVIMTQIYSASDLISMAINLIEK